MRYVAQRSVPQFSAHIDKTSLTTMNTSSSMTLWKCGLLYCGMVAVATAQTIATWSFTKFESQVQTNVSTLGPSTYQLQAKVTGSDLNLLSAAQFQPLGVGPTYTLAGAPGSISYNSMPPVSAAATLDGTYGNGNYSVTLGGTTVSSIGFGSSDNYLAPTPIATFSQGTWSSNKLIIDPTQSLTISWTVPNNFGSTGVSDSMLLYVNGPGSPIQGLSPYVLTSGASGSTAQYTISANALQSGMTYNSGLEFIALMSSDGADFGSAQGSFTFENATNFQLQAIPEPSTYAAISGLLALAVAAYRRRRRA